MHPSQPGYWLRRRVSRRRALTATGTVLSSAAFLAACGDEEPPQAAPTASLDATTQVPQPRIGGSLVWQSFGDPQGGLDLIKTFNPGVYQLASLTHDGLLDFAYGQPGNPGIGVDVVPSLAQALPEISADKLTVTFKLRPARFHNGRDLTSEDAKWTYDTLATAEESAYKQALGWIESTEAPDPSTLVVKARFPNADVIQGLTFYSFGAILAREHQESAAAETSLIGSGPFKFLEYSPPGVTRYARNPEYATAPGKPYFEEVTRLGSSDLSKRQAEVLSGNAHFSYWFTGNERDQIKNDRRELQVFQYGIAGSGSVYIRNDVAPFNDRRVRQALSMAYDRELLSASVSNGEGLPDQALSRTGEAWEFRGPEDLPRSDLYTLNLAEAAKLMSAANQIQPIAVSLPTWGAGVIGQRFLDEITSITTQWRNNGLIDATLVEDTFATSGPRQFGNYESLQWGTNATSTLPVLGIAIRNKYLAPPEGVMPPTQNICYVNNPTLNGLLDAQVQEFDRTARIALYRQIEEILSEEMVHTSGVTAGELAYFLDPSIQGAQVPRDAYNGSVAWIKHWYFE
jgi:ABC-type transport system substrate-binding protein